MIYQQKAPRIFFCDVYFFPVSFSVSRNANTFTWRYILKTYCFFHVLLSHLKRFFSERSLVHWLNAQFLSFKPLCFGFLCLVLTLASASLEKNHSVFLEGAVRLLSLLCLAARLVPVTRPETTPPAKGRCIYYSPGSRGVTKELGAGYLQNCFKTIWLSCLPCAFSKRLYRRSMHCQRSKR